MALAFAKSEHQMVDNGVKLIPPKMPAQLVTKYGVQAKNQRLMVMRATLANLHSALV